MVNYACAFSQSELGKHFEWIIKLFNKLSKIYKYINTSNNSSQNSLIYFILVILASSSYSILIIPRDLFRSRVKKNWGSFAVVFRLILGIISGRVKIWQLSRRRAKGEIECGIQIASSPSFSLPAAKAPRRACSQATLNLACSRLRDVCLFLSRLPHYLRAWNRLPWTWGSDAWREKYFRSPY